MENSIRSTVTITKEIVQEGGPMVQVSFLFLWAIWQLHLPLPYFYGKNIGRLLFDTALQAI